MSGYGCQAKVQTAEQVLLELRQAHLEMRSCPFHAGLQNIDYNALSPAGSSKTRCCGGGGGRQVGKLKSEGLTGEPEALLFIVGQVACFGGFLQ